MAQQPSPPFRIAVLSIELSTVDGKTRLLPAGDFRARDGRPFTCDAWHLDEERGRALVAALSQRQTRMVIDYGHQTLLAAQNGKPAPASGWIDPASFEWREDGLYGQIKWTAAAAAAIKAEEYLYLSPVFPYDEQGNVLSLEHIALTNTPALDDQPELVAALSTLVAASTTTAEEQPSMDELLERVIWFLNLPVTTTREEAIAELNKLIDQLTGGQGLAAASINLPKLLADKDAQIAALSSKTAALSTQATPDPSQWVPVSTMKALQDQVAALSTQVHGRKVDELVVAALSDGRLLVAQEAWARDLGASDIDKLRGYLDTAQPIAALSATQTGGKQPAADHPSGLDDATLAVCALMGNDPAAVKKQLEG